MVEKKRWTQLVPSGTFHHLAIIRFHLDRTSRLHTHDFPEIFWVERGIGRHHINGTQKTLHTGDLIFVRPPDQHVLEAVTADGFTLVNLAYDPRLRRSLLSRHGPELSPWLAPISALPFRAQLPAANLPAWRQRVERLATAPTSRLAAESFLLNLLDQLRHQTQAVRPAMPDWLRQACELLNNPAVFSRGAPGLVHASGRSAEHVARTVRAVFGVTPSDLVNQVRMQHAARELRITERPIADIALDCGLNNLSHFYGIFRRAHDLTPRHYRLAHQRMVL